MKKHSVFGYDPYYNFDGNGKLDALEAGFQLGGAMMEMEAIMDRKPLDLFADTVSDDGLFDDDDFDDDFDGDFGGDFGDDF